MKKAIKDYYFLDMNIVTKKIVDWGISQTATLTGETEDEDVHRIFLTKGQYNKLIIFLK
jgi:hypothetical protein